MAYKRKFFLRMILTFLIMSGAMTVSAQAADVFDYDKGAMYSSSDYYSIAQTLASTYPELLHLEVIGYSHDNKPIFALLMTANVEEAMSRDDLNLYRQHYYVEAGTHGRETVNPPLLLKAIEDYAKDYYDDGYISEFNLSAELSQAVIHFIPLVNPDGFDLVKFGASSVKTAEGRKLLAGMAATDYTSLKANVAGVDLNRNYPDEYYDPITRKWIDKFQRYPGEIFRNDTANVYYAGPYGGSEPETRAIMNYVQRYDFRNFLSFHSKGEFIDCGKYWFGVDYNKRSLDLATVLQAVNGYRVESYSSGVESGFFSDYAAAQTLKPVVTIETTLAPLPTDQSLYRETYNENYLLPLYAVRQGREAGYFKYRVYVDGIYVRDFSDYVYAKAHADRLTGAVLAEAAGVPEKTLEQAIAKGAVLTQYVKELADIQSHWAKATIERLMLLGAVTGYGDATFKPDNRITRAEFLKLAFTSAAKGTGAAPAAAADSAQEHWAAGIFGVAVEQEILKPEEVLAETWNEPITRYEMIRILTRLSEKTLGEPKIQTEGIEEKVADYDRVAQNEAYVYFVEQAYGKGLVSGMDESGTFAGDLTGTRAQAAAMVLALVDMTARKMITDSMP